ncbi:MAG: flagellar biosynthesis regulator FlaF [Rhodobacterales bacterium]|nr:flagellar biosynthesis regulator FlaF [Rhodobacterales bacterium]
MAFKAYGEVTQRTAGEKDIELALFRQITDALKQVSEAEDVQPTDWAEAIHRNQQLWTTIAIDLLHPGNALPDELKRSLLYLAEFVRQSSMKIMAGEGEIADLIEVNQSIMNGLSGAVAPVMAGEGV